MMHYPATSFIVFITLYNSHRYPDIRIQMWLKLTSIIGLFNIVLK